MADWVWTEGGGTALTIEPRLRASRFGDGYEQRAPDGINTMAEQWEYAADEVDDAVADDMDAFLRERGGVLAFNYVPLRKTVAIRVVCKRWTRTFSERPGISTFRATFEQDFGP